MKPCIIFITLFAAATLTYSCTKKDSLPATPLQPKPDTTVQTTPPAPVDAVVSSEWLVLRNWKKEIANGQNYIAATVDAPKLSDSILKHGAVLIFLHDKTNKTFTAIPNNEIETQQNYIESDDYLFTSLRKAGSIFIAVLGLTAQQDPDIAFIESLTEYRYFLIPESRLDQGLDYKNYKAVCNYYNIKQ